MKKISFGLVIAIVAIIFFGAWSVYIFMQSPKIGYVRSAELIEQYQGTREARLEFEKKRSGLMANVDSLRMNFEKSRQYYVSNALKLSSSQKTDLEKSLIMQQNQLDQYSQAIEQKINEEDSKMMQAVLSQINSFIEEYGEANDYDVILGTTLSGSLLYGQEKLDITKGILAELNSKYAGK